MSDKKWCKNSEKSARELRVFVVVVWLLFPLYLLLNFYSLNIFCIVFRRESLMRENNSLFLFHFNVCFYVFCVQVCVPDCGALSLSHNSWRLLTETSLGNFTPLLLAGILFFEMKIFSWWAAWLIRLAIFTHSSMNSHFILFFGHMFIVCH